MPAQACAKFGHHDAQKLSDMSKSDANPPTAKPATAVIRAGRDKSITGPFVNPPVVHASTVLYDSVDDMVHRRQRYAYGRGNRAVSVRAVSDFDGAPRLPLERRPSPDGR
jgi:hypothetical protein